MLTKVSNLLACENVRCVDPPKRCARLLRVVWRVRGAVNCDNCRWRQLTSVFLRFRHIGRDRSQLHIKNRSVTLLVGSLTPHPPRIENRHCSFCNYIMIMRWCSLKLQRIENSRLVWWLSQMVWGDFKETFVAWLVWETATDARRSRHLVYVCIAVHVDKDSRDRNELQWKCTEHRWSSVTRLPEKKFFNSFHCICGNVAVSLTTLMVV